LRKRRTENNFSISHAILTTLKEFGANSAQLTRQTRIQDCGMWNVMLCRLPTSPHLRRL